MRSEVMKSNPEQSFQLSENQILNIRSGEINLSCTSGIIWITWAGGHEKCLTKGESLVIESHINICIQAFTASSIRLLRTQTGILGIQHRIHKYFTMNRLRQMEIGFVE